jgi:hypothetical protein
MIAKYELAMDGWPELIMFLQESVAAEDHTLRGLFVSFLSHMYSHGSTVH